MREPTVRPNPLAKGLSRESADHFDLKGIPRDPYTIAVESLVLWLNGWEPASNYLERQSLKSRQTLTNLIYGGDATGKRQAAEDHSPESRERIIALLETVCRAISTISEWSEPGTPGLLGDLGGRMQRYATYPTLLFYNGHVALCQKTPHSEFHTYDTDSRRWSPPETPRGEVMAAHAIIDIAAAGLIDRVRQCACGTWFYAKRLHGISCTSKCRADRHQKTEEYRGKKRENGRKEYAARKALRNAKG